MKLYQMGPLCAFPTNADLDNICGDIDVCPNTRKNDFDSDAICDNIDSCLDDDINDPDTDEICSIDDVCPYDPDNDVALHSGRPDSDRLTRYARL